MTYNPGQFKATPLIERFYQAVPVRVVGKCWPHTLRRYGIGYGMVRRETGERVRLHRLSYEIFKGTIPDATYVLHTCDNAMCCNPDHLYLGTHKQNMEDRCKRKRTARGTKQGLAKLDECAVKEIRASNKSHAALGREYKVAPETIASLRQGKTWKHI